MSSPAHLILTRFNCRFAARWTRLALDPTWLRHRFELFERYCLPSVRAQTTNEFKWLIFFDSGTPEPYRERIGRFSGANIRPFFVGVLDAKTIVQAILSESTPGADYVITTRLDNDDAIAVDFVERVRRGFVGEHRRYLNFPEGYVLKGRRLYRRRDPSNAFVSLIERTDRVEGVWAVPHTEVASHGTVTQLHGPPAWLQVIHGVNVSNRVRGARCRLAELSHGFPTCADPGGAPEGEMDLWFDRRVLTPLRSGIECVRAVAKGGRRVAVRAFGSGRVP